MPGWVHLKSEDGSSSAIMSATDGVPDGLYRYALMRRWDHENLRHLSPDVNLLWCMLNPSTADHQVDDATIRRVSCFSRGFGADACTVVNLYALRSADPKQLRRHPDPVGPLNDTALRELAKAAGRVVCAWGTLGAAGGRDKVVLGLFREVGAVTLALDISKDGHPKHPLYLPKTAQLIDYAG